MKKCRKGLSTVENRNIVSYKIHPGIGIARVGNSPDQFFIGPEAPGQIPAPQGGWKDKKGRLKRQASRFRVYGYDEEGRVVREITLADAQIIWSVTLANTKGSGSETSSRKKTAPLRNSECKAQDRKRLEVTPGTRSIQGASQGSVVAARFDGGFFMDVEVPLGELRTDEDGRLLVLGGWGKSESTKLYNRIRKNGMNDNWYDDVSDGLVRARIVLADGTELQAEDAWVVVAPPNYAPGLVSPATLYDVALEAAVENQWMELAEQPSFTKDIYPILKRAFDHQWLTEGAVQGDYALLANPSDDKAALRKQVFDRFLSPNHARPKQSQEEAIVWHAVTKTQYLMLERWAEGNFVADWKGVENVSSLEELPIEMQPAALDAAPLLACSGGELFAGMNSVWPLRQKENYAEPFRIRADKHRPGDLTRGASLPWQAEFYANSGTVTEGDWWPSLRPQLVVTEGETRQQWDRGIDHDNDMATAWSRLGIVTRQEAADGSVTFTEIERGEIDPRKFEGLTERDFYHILNNIDVYYEYLPTAKRLAQRYFAECEELMNSPHFEPLYRHFPYSKEAFDHRLNWIYEESVNFYTMFDVKEAAKNIPIESVYERIRQFTPTNMMDGAWLQNITKAGPADRIKSALFAIYSDELGNGKIEENHSNVYRNLLESLGMYMPDIRSRSFVDQKELFDSSFSNPVFQLAVSMFPRDFFPELLGMTLFLEWESTPTFAPVVQLLKHYGIDPHYFTLHVAIDNVDSGHGAMGKDCVEWYLEDIRSKGGEEAVQEQWRRIWRGYVCFATTGRHNLDLVYSTLDVSLAACKERMMELILKKAKYGAPQHKDAKNMPNIGKMFDDPERMLDMLNKAGYFIPGDPENSRFMKLMNFDGPMFRVFTDQELKVIRDYIYSLNREEEATKPIDLGAAMKALVVKKADLFDIVLSSSDEWTNTKTVQEVSDDPIGTMRDLVHGKFAIPYNIRQSRLAFLVGQGGFLFFEFTDEERTIVQNWIAVGCPIPGACGRAALLSGPYVAHVKAN